MLVQHIALIQMDEGSRGFRGSYTFFLAEKMDVKISIMNQKRTEEAIHDITEQSCRKIVSFFFKKTCKTYVNSTHTATFSTVLPLEKHSSRKHNIRLRPFLSLLFSAL